MFWEVRDPRFPHLFLIITFGPPAGRRTWNSREVHSGYTFLRGQVHMIGFVSQDAAELTNIVGLCVSKGIILRGDLIGSTAQ